ncbi:ubiquinol oxidase subunit II [Pokkaliibacter plantistimulans]|uniref:Ubiquinol oxidase subunit II n=1 Tax=Pokkaliibacter plantistimulans TaxID=1635171 RepID=A0ABX5M4L9_9GAMM|nr:cytochrome d ubiquinol oxidase subunit II [Pokkaliibacter plantistimulans]PXF32518.1 ubiquinol oxidase subunit II [Pokkaliibacter plantistimulans]
MEWALLYFLIMGFAILMYVLLDGFDLGLGILYPWFDTEAERDHMMRSISHVWDGNETWLVFGGVVLFAAFPLAYSTILSTLYTPIIIMLIALIFRGVAFEYRFKSHRSKPLWDLAFAAGSTVAAMCQGMILGAIVQGADMSQPVYDRLDWFSPFTILTGFAVMAGYALLACCYLRMKSRGEIALRAAHLGRRLVIWVMLGMALVSLWTVLAEPEIRQRWLGGLRFLILLPLPLITILCAVRLFRDLRDPAHEQRPFYLAAALFLFGFAGLVVSLFPYLIPHSLTLWQAQAPESTLKFMLVGVCFFLPMVCLYTFWGYRIFSGKVEDFEEGY